MPAVELTYVFMGFLILSCLTGFVLLYCKLNRMARQLVTLTEIRTPAVEAAGPSQGGKQFGSALLDANMKSLLRQQAEKTTPAERYRLIRSLASHGLDHQQIADILSIGQGEAEQLVKLARLRFGDAPKEAAA